MPEVAARDMKTRDTEQRGMKARDPEEFRKFQWKPAEALPMPVAPDGWRYRYIRKAIMGTPDVNNFGKAMREGWATVPLSDHPEMASSIDPNAKNSGLIEIGALVLCKIPIEVANARSQYYAAMNDQQMKAVDRNLMRASDPRMPIFNERESKVTFGKGT